ncbi:MAG TPA: transferrin receptor-like dimerization domain-containing protein [Gemmatimonadales bacterium]|nr:transferrin receptor-like dimerization domain-containing protein [Gemmatimonadales bacterium]
MRLVTVRRSVVVAPFLYVLLLAAAPSPAGELRGYSADAAAAEREWETKFRALPVPDSLRSYMRRLSARPHHVGSAYDKDNADWILAKFRSFGLDAHIESFDVLFPTPKERVVELVAPTKFVAKLQEPPVAGDPTSSQQPEQLPTYNAYSIDGDVTGPLVYVNYGVPADYERLERFGVSVKGAIVIARYFGSWRGIKPKVAAEHGAVGCIIYSDPKDDGYAQGDVYPQGPWRPRDGVQRGSVMDMPLYPGDPLTPGVGATKDAKRLPVSEAATITKIPVLPISYGDAQPLLAALGGRVAPAEWRGALNLTYHVGPGPARVHLRVKSDWSLKPLYDVIARIPGAAAPDEWVIRGNHHDAWVNGAQDPISGLVPLLEEARGYGELLKQGWKPRRTIIYAAWDGEEPALLGSTEWVEAHADELAAKAVAYLNTDTNSRGYLFVGGSHSLEALINDVARDVADPETKLTIWKRAQLRAIADASSAETRQELRQRADLRIEALGSGSDFTPFLQHIGIASLNLGFGGESGGGIYHSIYDDFKWFTTFDDTSFAYSRALAQTVGTAVLRLADAQVLPYQFTGLAETVASYTKEVEKLAKDKRDEIRERNRELEEGVFAGADDPRQPTVPPTREELPPYLNFAPLDNGTDALTRAAERYERAFTRAQGGGGTALARPDVQAVNATLRESERALTTAAGLPRRPWYRHAVYAPGFYTGYGVKTLPGVREAIEEKHWSEAEQQIVTTGKVLEHAAEVIARAADQLEKGAPGT